MRLRTPLIIAAVAASALGAFLVFRPDRAVVDQRVEDTLAPELRDALAAGTPTTAAPATAAPDGPGPATTAAPDGPGPATTAPGPVLVADGSFAGQAGHEVQGRAAVLDTPDGRALVLEDLESDNGPDLQLYLSPSAGGSVDGGRLLEPLRGNQGTQLYRLPDDVDLSALPNVVIWCERFSTPFGTATLSAVT